MKYKTLICGVTAVLALAVAKPVAVAVEISFSEGSSSSSTVASESYAGYVSYNNIYIYPLYYLPGDKVGFAWNGTYVGYYGDPMAVGKITITPQPNEIITLTSFDLAFYDYSDGWNSGTYLKISSGTTTFLNRLAEGNPDPLDDLLETTYTTSFSTAPGVPMVIELGYDWDLGIDNINFDISQARVPTPTPDGGSTMLLIGGAVIGLGLLRRRLS